MRRDGHPCDPQAFEAFWFWINERHMIWCKRQTKHPWPWTADPILQEYRFCNVFRELDIVTIQFKELIRDRFSDHENLWFAYCLARQINWPDTVVHIMRETGFPKVWNPDAVYKAMRQRQEWGEKLYTGAYMLRGDIQREGQDNNKPRYTVFRVLDPVWRAFDELGADPDLSCGHPLSSTIQSATEWLAGHSGWGGFLAYEVATDLRHTRYLCNAPDIMTWANAGPGAKRGLNRIFGRPLTKALSQQQALEEMRWLLKISPEYLGPHMPALEMRDVEHSLCETDKYLRVKLGEGRPRSKYQQPF